MAVAEPSISRLAYDAAIRIHEEQDDRLKTTRNLVAQLGIGTLLISAAGTLSAFDEKWRMWVSAVGYLALVLTLVGFIAAAAALVLLSKGFKFYLPDPVMITAERYATADDFYSAFVYHFAEKNIPAKMRKRCRWRHLATAGIVAATVGCGLVWADRLLL